MTSPRRFGTIPTLLAACLGLASCTENARQERATPNGPIGAIVDDRELYSGSVSPREGIAVTLIVRQIAVSNATRLRLRGFDRRGGALLQGKAGAIDLLVNGRPLMIDDGRTATIATPATVQVSTGNDTVMFEVTQLLD